MNDTKILLAGATGYLGRFITQELIDRAYEVKAVVRNKNKVKVAAPNLTIIEAEVTKPKSLQGIFMMWML
jgi:uncharacterized protein YbjT (DUF2867 family)